MATSSEYHFPIFISSTDYNLIDLRAELARHLKELSYKPILSSSDGFPDKTPDLEPWESCLPVLMNCFVMVLIIDGRYGKPLMWPNYKKELGNKKISPTHAEYRYAHKHKKRMLVFIRSNLFHYYQSYRATLKNTKGNRKEAEKLLMKTLPDGIDFKTLEFIEEVKTTSSIPWIKEFDDVTSIKDEVHKKMINELAETFLVKDKRLEVISRAFTEVTKCLNPKERIEVFRSVGAPDEFIEEIEETRKRIQRISVLKREEKELQAKRDSIANELGSKKKILKANKNKLEQEVNELTDKLNWLKKDIRSQEISTPSFSVSSSGTTIASSMPIFSSQPTTIYGRPMACTQCNKNVSFSNSHFCTKCLRTICNTCWPNANVVEINKEGRLVTQYCPECINTSVIDFKD